MIKNLLITVDDNHLSDLSEIVDKIKDQVLEITKVRDYGVISVKSDQSAIQFLKKIKGVESVKEDTLTRYIAPPDSEIQ